MHLISVLLPAPLSPTKAVTLPGKISKSTSRKTCTAPKLLLIPRSDSSGSVPLIAETSIVAPFGRTQRPAKFNLRSGHVTAPSPSSARIGEAADQTASPDAFPNGL